MSYWWRYVAASIGSGTIMANWDTEGAPILLAGNLTINSADRGKVYQLDSNISATITLGTFGAGDVFVITNTSVTGRLTLSASTFSIDDSVSRILLPNEAAIILFTGSQYIKLGGRTVPAFSSVSIPQNSSVAASGQAFTKIDYTTVVDDSLLMWDTTNKVMILPRTSKYILTTNLRFDDGALAFSYENGSNTTPADGAWANWFDTNQNSPTFKRNGSQVSRVITGTLNQTWLGYYYADRASPSNIISAAFTVLEIPVW